MLLAGVRMKDKWPVINWLAAPGVCVRACVCVYALPVLFFLVYLHWTVCVYNYSSLDSFRGLSAASSAVMQCVHKYTLHDSTGR